MFWELNCSDAVKLARKTGGILFIQPAWLVGEIKYANPMQEHYSIISFHTF